MEKPVKRVLMITNQEGEVVDKLRDFLLKSDCKIFIERDWATGIQLVQNHLFNAIIIDTRVKGMDIRKAIQIFKSIDQKVKIIVKTDCSTKEFEAQIRQEKIYYYHIDSFDAEDLKLAVKSAIAERRVSYVK